MIISRKSVIGASERSLARFLGRARRAAGLGGPISVLITSSRELRRLNRRFRGHDRPTDVLSFPALTRLGLRPAASGNGSRNNCNGGDIAISADIACANARRLGHSPADELKILVLHGVLHLAGYDHEHEHGSPQSKMARLEARLRRELGLPESLIERARRDASPKVAPRDGIARKGPAAEGGGATLKVRRTRAAANEAAAPSRTPVPVRRKRRPQ